MSFAGPINVCRFVRDVMMWTLMTILPKRYQHAILFQKVVVISHTGHCGHRLSHVYGHKLNFLMIVLHFISDVQTL